MLNPHSEDEFRSCFKSLPVNHQLSPLFPPFLCVSKVFGCKMLGRNPSVSFVSFVVRFLLS
jgi:hypothetical protein